METKNHPNLAKKLTVEELQTTINELSKALEYKHQETNRLRITLGLMSFLLIATWLLRIEEKHNTTRPQDKALSK